MIETEKPQLKSEFISKDGTYGKFVFEPLERGFGNTIGNSLRRVLLSSLPGVAVTSIRINGVLHEFSTIPGVKEDVAEIVLNLKELNAKLYSDGPKTLSIDAKGPCVVTAGMIDCDSQTEILNKNLHIATLNKGAVLSMDITIDKGVGYVPSDRERLGDMADVIGVLAVDSIFTPVVKANYSVENTRVGQITDYDKLTLEVWTNGVVNACEAVAMSANILIRHISPFVELAGVKCDSDEEVLGSSNALSMSLEDLNFSVRAFNCLKRAGICTVADLVSKTEEDMGNVRNLGKKSIQEISKKLQKLGLSFKRAEEDL